MNHVFKTPLSHSYPQWYLSGFVQTAESVLFLVYANLQYSFLKYWQSLPLTLEECIRFPYIQSLRCHAMRSYLFSTISFHILWRHIMSIPCCFQCICHTSCIQPLCNSTQHLFCVLLYCIKKNFSSIIRLVLRCFSFCYLITWSKKLPGTYVSIFGSSHCVTFL